MLTTSKYLQSPSALWLRTAQEYEAPNEENRTGAVLATNLYSPRLTYIRYVVTKQNHVIQHARFYYACLLKYDNSSCCRAMARILIHELLLEMWKASMFSRVVFSLLLARMLVLLNWEAQPHSFQCASVRERASVQQLASRSPILDWRTYRFVLCTLQDKGSLYTTPVAQSRRYMVFLFVWRLVFLRRSQPWTRTNLPNYQCSECLPSKCMWHSNHDLHPGIIRPYKLSARPVKLRWVH